MPRNVSGTYSLYTPGNPVVPSTVITTTWANNTLSDLATAMTDSLSRSGNGGMSAPLQLAAGAVGTPGLTWTAETTSGWYRAAAGDFRYSIGGVDKFTITTSLVLTAGNFTVGGGALIGAATGGNQGTGTINATAVYDDGVLLANQAAANPTGTVGLAVVNGVAATFLRSDGAPALSQAITPTWSAKHIFSAAGSGSADTVQLASTLPMLRWTDTDSGTDLGQWQEFVSGTTYTLRTINDANSVANTAIQFTRNAVGPTVLDFGNASTNPAFNFLGSGTTAHGGNVTFTIGGTAYDVGYRGMPSRTITTSDNTTTTENGRSVLFTGAAGQTFTIDPDFGVAGNIMTVLNGGTGSLSIAETLSGTMTWLNGSGALSTGTRTLAIGGIATIWMVDANNAYIWGVGVT